MKQSWGRQALLCFFTAFCMAWALLFLLQAEPFGGRSLSVIDARAQYADFFLYFRSCLLNGSWNGYSFSKALGGNMIGVLCYYLLSPFNLLVVLFQPEDIFLFFHVLFVLKLSTICAACSVFLNGRFHHQLSAGMVLILSLCYAFSEYAIGQVYNFIWHDGVYMLPFILLGVYRLVRFRKSTLLAVSVGLSMVFNWYTAGINCLFAIVWFVVEWSLLSDEMKGNIKRFASTLLRLIIAMASGVLCSGALLIPTICAMIPNGRALSAIGELFNPAFEGSLSYTIRSFLPGLKSEWGELSLFCGSLTFLAAASVLFSKKHLRNEKCAAAFLIVFAVCMCYWQPLHAVFSLFTVSTGFHYRYSYAGILSFVFLAGLFFHKDQAVSVRVLIKAFLLWIGTLEAARLVMDAGDTEDVRVALLFVFLTIVCCGVWYSQKKKWRRTVAGFLCGMLCIGQLIYNASEISFAFDARSLDDYYPEQKKQIEDLRSYDDGMYRIIQSDANGSGIQYNGTTTNYNEALGYQYWSTTHYSSCPDHRQRMFLDRMGHRKVGDNWSVVRTCILPIDSLLGVKYFLSSHSINGLEMVESIECRNGKNVYQNPYCIPMAFVYTPVSLPTSEKNDPFLNQNALYARFLGEGMELFRPLKYTCTEREDGEQVYQIFLPRGERAIYGNLCIASDFDSLLKKGSGAVRWGVELNINDERTIPYAGTFTQSVFDIPTRRKDAFAYVEVDSLAVEEAQFYALDLMLMAEAARRLSQNVPTIMSIKDGYAYFETEGKENQHLFVSIPYDSGWRIEVNGQKARPDLIEDCLYSIPLQTGYNVVEMVYQYPGKWAGWIATAMGTLLLILMHFFEKRKQMTLSPKESL